MSKSRKEQLRFYNNLLKENEILLLKSKDDFFKNHYQGSPLNVMTNFSGTEGEAIIDKTGKITIFVDTRYHILVDKEVFPDIEVYKMDLSENFIDAFKKKFKKNTILYVDENIALNDYLRLDSHFDLRKYCLPEKFSMNCEENNKKEVFLVDFLIETQSFQQKIEKYAKLNKNYGKIIIFDLDIISYFTNIRSFKNKYSSNFKSILYFDIPNKNYILFVPKKTEFGNIKIDKLKYMELSEFDEYINSIDDEIYVNPDDISLKNFLLIKRPKEVKNDAMRLISSIKPISVIEHLKEAFKKTDVAIANFKRHLKEGMSEEALAKLFEKEMYLAGAKALSFKTLLAINESSASIHYPSYSKNKILKKESILLLDCGGYYEGGYATDITRTFYFGSNPKKIHKKVYTYVLKAFLNCYLSKITDARKLDTIARDILKPLFDDGFNFNHGLGHGIGTSVHQNPPRLSMITKDVIKPFQVHSIEPGLYGKSISCDVEFGVRIENCVYSDVEYNKISLSRFPFEEILIDYSLLNINEIDAVKKWQKDFEI